VDSRICSEVTCTLTTRPRAFNQTTRHEHPDVVVQFVGCACAPFLYPGYVVLRPASALGLRFPLPRAGEGQGEGVSGQAARQRGSLTLALSQRERGKKAQALRYKGAVCRVRLRTVSLPRLCGAQSAPYCRVYPKTVRRTVVLCRGGPMWPPTPPGQPHRVAPTAAPTLSSYEQSRGGSQMRVKNETSFFLPFFYRCEKGTGVEGLVNWRHVRERYRPAAAKD